MAILFARLQADVPLKLRRGAWYRVIQLDDLQAVIEVNHRKVGVLRAWLEIQQRPPQTWTIVAAPEEAKRKAPPHLRGIYGVCPNCRGRAPLPKKLPRVLECAKCRKEYAISSPNGNGA
jgi:hypothetical protein